MKRLQDAIGTPLLARQGRGVVLTARGERLAADSRPHVAALFQAALAPARFDPLESTRVLRIGVSDAAESWLLPGLLRLLAERAPAMRVVAMPVQFRTVAELMQSAQLDFAITLADEMPVGMAREPLIRGGMICLFDPRVIALPKKLTLARYLAEEHVIVSYAGDLRGVVEDLFGFTRRVRCSVATFHAIGAIVERSALLATVPELVARDIRRTRSRLDTRVLPFEQEPGQIDLIWPEAKDDEACQFARRLIRELAAALPT
jgi:LysR family transcriptional activator of mexEF-oprN operon